MNSKSDIAVITGDVVNSSNLSEREINLFREKVKGFNSEFILLGPEFYRGDSFQLATHLQYSLFVALKIRIEMKCIKDMNDVRISIGIGNMSEKKENILLATGSAFVRSGKNLDRLKNMGLNLLIVTGNKELDDELETYCELIDPYLKSLTVNQANIIKLKIDDAVKWQLKQDRQKKDKTFVMPLVNTSTTTQADISSQLNISQPAVSKSLKTANWKVIKKFTDRYRQLIEKNYGIFE